jgi:hypothetical protein
MNLSNQELDKELEFARSRVMHHEAAEGEVWHNEAEERTAAREYCRRVFRESERRRTLT